MSETRRIARRSFLGASGSALLGWWAVARRPWRTLVADRRRLDASAKLAGLLRDAESARAVGLAYLRAAPEEANEGRLASSIIAGLPSRRRNAARMGDGDLRSHIAEHIRRDFERGDVTILDGWVLSLTEARLCALATMVARKR